MSNLNGMSPMVTGYGSGNSGLGAYNNFTRNPTNANVIKAKAERNNALKKGYHDEKEGPVEDLSIYANLDKNDNLDKSHDEQLELAAELAEQLQEETPEVKASAAEESAAEEPPTPETTAAGGRRKTKSKSKSKRKTKSKSKSKSKTKSKRKTRR